ncbi:MAG: alpha/beta hydrolase [Bacteroidetes bacterium]|jgi:pimeloyl-ACP methyl ester carboxylesterase|nr:alpha/beta hydrolase [Bacteroidota bacterium]MBK8329514.1 alpha/beta hydrolase [Bacteroidota bacterium]MBK9299247.1 alpha/beta hydrolase [Bacteroidota bacterium]MBK9481239.1 alpha/beta hydrolase [Bacteroidota bacterium]HMT35034.1 alpha/beta hydrolase [Chitinophagaceae bacterium]
MKKLFLLLIICMPFLTNAHGFDESELVINATGVQLSGTLTLPAHAHGNMPLVIIIAGSGPTDRDCNGQGFKSDAYKKMAAQFALNGIATFRYDKRGVGKSIVANMKEEDLLFSQSISDAQSVIANFEKDTRFSKIIIAGHSEGSLVGMMCAQANHKYISIAGVSKQAHDLLKIQLKGKLGDLEKSTFLKLDSLANGQDIACDNPMLMSLFRPSVLPYLKSWFKINPVDEIKKVKCPILIINGTKDLQVAEINAQSLKEANPKSTLLIVPDMNHCLTEIASDKQEDNLASYNKPELALSKKMIDSMILFIIQ